MLKTPKITLLQTTVETSIGHQLVVPWTFFTRVEARKEAVYQQKRWNFARHVKIGVAKFRTVILEVL